MAAQSAAAAGQTGTEGRAHATLKEAAAKAGLDRFRARDNLIRRHHLVDETNSIGLLCVDPLARQDELERASLAHKAWQPLRAAPARHQTERHFGTGSGPSR